jgi:hypothetical protein
LRLEKSSVASLERCVATVIEVAALRGGSREAEGGFVASPEGLFATLVESLGGGVFGDVA